MLADWCMPKVHAKRGRRVNRDFEQHVLDELRFTVAGAGGPEVLASVLLSYTMVKTAAQDVRKLPAFASDAAVQAMLFSDAWVHGFLERQGLRRRRVVTEQKPPPPVDIVRSRLNEIRAAVKKYPPQRIINADETMLSDGKAHYT